jgi:hypothetical protein
MHSSTRALRDTIQPTMTPNEPLPEHSDPCHAVPSPGFSVTPPAAARPGFDPSNSPLMPGGKHRSPEPIAADASLLGLLHPEAADRPRVIYRVRREGWVARRAAARGRFKKVAEERESSANRVLAGLEKRGILARSKENAVRPRFNLRGLG